MFAVSAGILFLFYSATAIALAKYVKPKMAPDTHKGISVVVCAKNEYRNLLELIPRLIDQKYPDFEVILVDDKSTDETYEYAIELEQKVKHFKLKSIDATPDHINNKKYAITLGVRAAKNEHILLTDADCMPHSEYWIAEMAAGFSSDAIQFVLGFSQYFKTPGFLNMFIRYETLITALQYIGIGLLGNPYMGVGRNMAYQKSLFLDKNGFGRFQGVVGGDDDLLVNQHAKRKNTRFVLSQDATVYSIAKSSVSAFVQQKTRHLSVGKHYRMSDKLLLTLIFGAKIIFWLSLFAAILAGYQIILAGGGFLLVMVSMLMAILALKKKTGDNTDIGIFPLLDITYIFYYLSTGLKVLFTKKIKWK